MFRVSPFASLLKLLPRGLFDRLVEQHGADRYRKRFDCWQQLVVMIYAQFSGASSLRVLESSFNAHSAHHYHLRRIACAGWDPKIRGGRVRRLCCALAIAS